MCVHNIERNKLIYETVTIFETSLVTHRLNTHSEIVARFFTLASTACTKSAGPAQKVIMR